MAHFNDVKNPQTAQNSQKDDNAVAPHQPKPAALTCYYECVGGCRRITMSHHEKRSERGLRMTERVTDPILFGWELTALFQSTLWLVS